MFAFRFYHERDRKATRKEKWNFLDWELRDVVPILVDFDQLCHMGKSLYLYVSQFSLLTIAVRPDHLLWTRKERDMHILKKLIRAPCPGEHHRITSSPNLFSCPQLSDFMIFVKSLNLEIKDLVFNFSLAILKFCDLNKSLPFSGPYYAHV